MAGGPVLTRDRISLGLADGGGHGGSWSSGEGRRDTWRGPHGGQALVGGGATPDPEPALCSPLPGSKRWVHHLARGSCVNRKFQVFISSTYVDLKKERQAAVQAVLDAGHIPAGMELFSAGDQEQLEVIKRWIDESDIYMLILGVRYGSIEPVSKKSYTHFEYEYAVAQKKPVFAVYLAEAPFRERVKELAEQLESEDRKGYAEFRNLVKSKMCSEFSDSRDITIAVLKTLVDFARKPELQNAGWVRGRDVPDTGKLTSENAQLNAEVARLTAEVAWLSTEINALRTKTEGTGADPEDVRIGSFRYRQLVATFKATEVQTTASSLLDALIKYQGQLVLGISDPVFYKNDSLSDVFVQIIPRLATFGLVMRDMIRGKPGYRTSELGDAFLARLAVERVGTA
ncbi:MAG TPA: DUF4062 domain-containing protein [Sorangium sp.]|nr:DUF4062 domain-containing protein [Sorangium sp.]